MTKEKLTNVDFVNNPGSEDYQRVYGNPGTTDWKAISESVFPKTYFSVDLEGEVPVVNWPSKELKEADFKTFELAINYIMLTLYMDDEEYNQHLPQMFEILKQSYLFQESFQKKNGKHDTTVGEHVLTVSGLTKTDGWPLADRMVLRLAAPFHDLAKAFNTGDDKLQYHALIASNVVKELLSSSQEFVQDNLKAIATSDTFEGLVGDPSRSNALVEKISTDYDDFTNQVSEIIRLHHVFENLDKGNLDLETVAAIVDKENVNLILLGLFVVADGGGSVTETEYEQYSQFLIENIKKFGELVDKIQLMNEAPEESFPEEVKRVVIQALQSVLRDLMIMIEELKNSLEEIINDASDFVAVSLLNILDTDGENL